MPDATIGRDGSPCRTTRVRDPLPLTYDEVDELVHRLVGNHALSAHLGARLLASVPFDAPVARTPAHDEKLRMDAEAVLTWDAPAKGADVLLFGHLRRFAKDVLRLLPATASGDPRLARRRR